ncbi:hypothetical protein GCM10009535_14750 [Streptomyces thermocarboxydovorans]|uniref:Uncharacterized protein n=1 Tax=Streptomyces thermocarboxydovorans TaxID=59298 RepID=A0ABN1HD54_9ACTN
MGRDDVGERADAAGGADGVEGQVVFVAAGVVGEVGAGEDLLGREEVVGAVLDRCDPGVFGEAEQGVGLDAGAGTGRDVVEGEGQVGGVRDV